MVKENLILIDQLCIHYNIELSFINALDNIGLLEIEILEQNRFIHQDRISDLEKMIRLHHELNVNIEGIDVVFNLIEKEMNLKKEINSLKNRLKLYEDQL